MSRAITRFSKPLPPTTDSSGFSEMSRAYPRIVASAENRPMLATLRIAFLVHSSASRNRVFHRNLRGPVALEIGQHEIPVSSVEQPVDQRTMSMRIARRKCSTTDCIENRREHRVGAVDRSRIVAPRSPGADLRLVEAEDEDVVRADRVADLDVRAIERADRQRAVQRELHIAGARCFGSGRGNLLATDRPPGMTTSATDTL